MKGAENGSGWAGEFRGKSVLIAGASGSLGERIAALFLAAGAVCCLHYRSHSARLEALRDKPVEGGRIPRLFRADLKHPSEAEALVAEARRETGRIDVVVNCMGAAVDDSVFLLDAAALRETLSSNLLTVANVCQAALPGMLAVKAGAIVTVSSITGEVGQPMRTLYGAAKGAVNAYMKSLARHAAPHGVRINCVQPQVVDGGMGDAMKARIRDLLLANTPLGRLTTEDEIAWPVLFLASSYSANMAGEGLRVTGGLVTW